MKSTFTYFLDADNYTIVAINDLFRMFIMQITAQFLFSINNDVDYFSEIFIENLLCIMIGLFTYWFIFNRFFSVSNDKIEQYDYNDQYFP